MLVSMNAVGADGRKTQFEQRMEVPEHGFLDIAASLDNSGMKKCLRPHLKAGKIALGHDPG